MATDEHYSNLAEKLVKIYKRKYFAYFLTPEEKIKEQLKDNKIYRNLND